MLKFDTATKTSKLKPKLDNNMETKKETEIVLDIETKNKRHTETETIF
jgi:hypothetical protein